MLLKAPFPIPDGFLCSFGYPGGRQFVALFVPRGRWRVTGVGKRYYPRSRSPRPNPLPTDRADARQMWDRWDCGVGRAAFSPPNPADRPDAVNTAQVRAGCEPDGASVEPCDLG